MNKLFCILIIALATPMLGGCSNGSSASPPTSITATEGDGRVILTWTPEPGVDYWLFTATDPALTAFNWTSLPNAHAYTNVATPFYMCGLLDGSQYYFAMNGRKDGGPGGPSSPTITTAVPPYNASANTWTLNPASLIQNIYGLGYASLKTCSNSAASSAGSFAAVGAGGAIFTSSDGQSWISPTTLPPGFSADLYAVTGHAANLNNPGNPALLLVAVGDGGTSVYSTDGGVTWLAGSSPGLTNLPLRSIAQAAGTFVAVGDAGTIISSTDGNNWTPHTSASVTTNNLNGVTRGNIFVAVGDSGTILTSGDGNTWSPHTASPATADNLRKVTSSGSLIVAVGDNGVIVTSKDDGATWYTQNLPGPPNLIGVAAEPQLAENDIVDNWLAVVPRVQFVAVDSSGNTYITQSSAASTNGQTWISANSTGISTNALVSSGFGYVAAGNAGATAYAF